MTTGNPLAHDVTSTFALVKNLLAEMRPSSCRKIKDSKNALANIFAAFPKIRLSKQQTNDSFSGFCENVSIKNSLDGPQMVAKHFLHFEGPRTFFSTFNL